MHCDVFFFFFAGRLVGSLEVFFGIAPHPSAASLKEL